MKSKFVDKYIQFLHHEALTLVLFLCALYYNILAFFCYRMFLG